MADLHAIVVAHSNPDAGDEDLRSTHYSTQVTAKPSNGQTGSKICCATLNVHSLEY